MRIKNGNSKVNFINLRIASAPEIYSMFVRMTEKRLIKKIEMEGLFERGKAVLRQEAYSRHQKNFGSAVLLLLIFAGSAPIDFISTRHSPPGSGQFSISLSYWG